MGLDQLHGSCTTLIMIDFLKKLFQINNDPLSEGIYAHDYSDIVQKQIREDYTKRWGDQGPLSDPNTHPWLFDPCDPPQGWSYDPYYEIWIEINNTNKEK